MNHDQTKKKTCYYVECKGCKCKCKEKKCNDLKKFERKEM